MAKHIGLVGGIGPAATVVYCRTLVRLHAAAGQPLALTIDHADIVELVTNLKAGRAAAQAAIFARHVDRLRAAGCEAVALTSIGAHFCGTEFGAVSSLPVLDARSALAAHFDAAGVALVGLLGTRVVMETGLYGMAGVELIVPDPDGITAVDAAYTAVAQAGAVTAKQRRALVAAGASLHARGAEVVLLGGTDLSVAFDGVDPGYPVVDSAVLHAEAIGRWAMEG